MREIKKPIRGAILWMLATTLVVFIPNISPWIATPFVLIGLIFVLGLLLAINLNIESDKLSEYLLYVGGLGFAFLVIGGLFINWALPYLGVLHPLAKLPLMIFFDASVIILALRIYLFKKNVAFPPALRWPNARNSLLGIIPWVFIILSVCGAEILNNGGNGTLTLITLLGIALYVFVLIANREHVDGWVYISALYSIGLSLLFMYSLRSSHILGWDINQEYQVFQTTLQNLRWKMSYYPGLDYNACMSITILPTIVKELTNIPSEYVYKVTFQLLFAILPVMIYVFARRYLNGALAFLAAFLLISQTWFFESMPALIRQEIAYIFYAALVLVLFDTTLSKRSRYILFYVFTIAVIISHYSTSYVLMAFLVVMLALSYITRYFIRSLRKQPMALTPTMLIVSLAVLFIWQVPLTSTIHTFKSFVTTKVVVSSVSTATTTAVKSATTTTTSAPKPSLISQVDSTIITIKNGVIASLVTPLNPNTNENLLLAEKSGVRLTSKMFGDQFYPTSTTSGYIPQAINYGRQLPSMVIAPVSFLLNVGGRASKLLLIDLLPLIGIVGMLVALRRRGSNGSYDLVLLNIGGFGLLMVMIFTPSFQAYYGVTRLYLQLDITFSTFAIIGAVIATNWLHRYEMIVVALMAILTFGYVSGAFDQLTGGPASIVLNQPPTTDGFAYTYDNEIASAQWIAANRIANDPIQADDVAYLRLQSFGNINSGSSAIFPQTIEQNSYVYLTDANAMGTGFNLYNGNLLTYNYPLTFLNNNKNLIYNDGGSKIYK